MKIDYISFLVPDPSAACSIREQSSGTVYGHLEEYTTQDYDRTDFTHVHISFSSGDPADQLLPLTSAGTCTLTRRSGPGLTVWAEFSVPTGADCRFDWALQPSEPACTIKIVIKKS